MTEMSQRRGPMADFSTNTDSEEPPSPTEPLGGANAPYTPTIVKVRSKGTGTKIESDDEASTDTVIEASTSTVNV